jgi:hypothetical protein
MPTNPNDHVEPANPESSHGSGSEAGRGIHGDADADGTQETGRSSRNGADRSGSEPLTGTDEIHKSGYGGEGGAPRTSSDKRE